MDLADFICGEDMTRVRELYMKSAKETVMKEVSRLYRKVFNWVHLLRIILSVSGLLPFMLTLIVASIGKSMVIGFL